MLHVCLYLNHWFLYYNVLRRMIQALICFSNTPEQTTTLTTNVIQHEHKCVLKECVSKCNNTYNLMIEEVVRMY